MATPYIHNSFGIDYENIANWSRIFDIDLTDSHPYLPYDIDNDVSTDIIIGRYSDNRGFYFWGNFAVLDDFDISTVLSNEPTGSSYYDQYGYQSNISTISGPKLVWIKREGPDLRFVFDFKPTSSSARIFYYSDLLGIIGPSGSAAGDTTSSISIVENSTDVHTFDANESVNWTLTGGADQSKFSINSSTGALSFNNAPDYENPTDIDTNNNYVVTVLATDSAGNTSNQTITITVNDIDENSP